MAWSTYSVSSSTQTLSANSFDVNIEVKSDNAVVEGVVSTDPYYKDGNRVYTLIFPNKANYQITLTRDGDGSGYYIIKYGGKEYVASNQLDKFTIEDVEADTTCDITLLWMYGDYTGEAVHIENNGTIPTIN